MALTEPPEHQAARQRTTAEDQALEARTLVDHVASAEQRRATLDHLREQHARQVAKAHDGQGVLPTIGES
jgi:hypothetical protein